MPNRLTKIYTRTGDQGETGLANGSRVSKNSARIELIGTVDELNSWIGLTRSQLSHDKLDNVLAQIQHQLFDLGGEFAIADPDYVAINQDEIDFLEQQLDELNDSLPALKEFILPAGSQAVCNIHLSRTVCRRTERIIIALVNDDSESVNPHAVAYLNRLSDLLFVAARFLVHERGEVETLWKPKEQRQTTE